MSNKQGGDQTQEREDFAELIASTSLLAHENKRLKEVNEKMLEALQMELWSEENGEAGAQKYGKPRYVERLSILRETIKAAIKLAE